MNRHATDVHAHYGPAQTAKSDSSARCDGSAGDLRKPMNLEMGRGWRAAALARVLRCIRQTGAAVPLEG